MDWTIQEIARLSGTTSRTLRHYDHIGLLSPTRLSDNGYRHYDENALARLQRILLLRELGLGLPAIGDVLAGQHSHADALRTHLGWLHSEKKRLDRQISAVENTIETMEGGEQLMAEEMFDGFDHTEYKSEVEQRWGADAYGRSDSWWRGQSAQQKQEWRVKVDQLGADWTRAALAGLDPASGEAQGIAERHVDWLSSIPGTPAAVPGQRKQYVLGLGDMYVADERFAANYGGLEGATFVRDALREFANRAL